MTTPNTESVEIPVIRDIEIPELPELASLFSHSKDLSERIVTDEVSLMTFRNRSAFLNEEVARLEGLMWLHVCDQKDTLGKPLLSNDKQRQSAYDSLRALSKTDSVTIPEKLKGYKKAFEDGVECDREVLMGQISLEALKRAFNLNVAVIKAMGV